MILYTMAMYIFVERAILSFYSDTFITLIWAVPILFVLKYVISIGNKEVKIISADIVALAISLYYAFEFFMYVS